MTLYNDIKNADAHSWYTISSQSFSNDEPQYIKHKSFSNNETIQLGPNRGPTLELGQDLGDEACIIVDTTQALALIAVLTNFLIEYNGVTQPMT